MSDLFLGVIRLEPYFVSFFQLHGQSNLLVSSEVA